MDFTNQAAQRRSRVWLLDQIPQNRRRDQTLKFRGERLDHWYSDPPKMSEQELIEEHMRGLAATDGDDEPNLDYDEVEEWRMYLERLEPDWSHIPACRAA